MKSVVNVMRESGCDVPEWMEKIKGPSKKEKKILRKKPVERDGIETVSKFDQKKIEKKRYVLGGLIWIGIVRIADANHDSFLKSDD